MRSFLAGVAFACLTLPAMAQESPGSVCKTIEEIRPIAEAHGATWIELTTEQRLFLAGAYAATPPIGPPPSGDKAVIARQPDKGGIVFWIDGAQACSPFSVSKELIDIMNDITSGAKDKGI